MMDFLPGVYGNVFVDDGLDELGMNGGNPKVPIVSAAAEEEVGHDNIFTVVARAATEFDEVGFFRVTPNIVDFEQHNFLDLHLAKFNVRPKNVF